MEGKVMKLDREEVKILYICDRKACEKCSVCCNHTSDISHAKNFERREDGRFWEVESEEGNQECNTNTEA